MYCGVLLILSHLTLYFIGFIPDSRVCCKFCALQLHDQIYSSIQYVGLSSKSADTMATTTRLSNVRGAGPAVECGLKNCKLNQNV